MTDEQIIKALECCLTNFCQECSLYGECRSTEKGRMDIILDLINRQKAEIERLNAKFERLMKEQLEKELFEGNHYSFHNGKLCAIPKTEEKQIKSEARKEFAERLKEYTKELKIGDNIYLQVVGVGRIDNLAEEMTE